LVKRIVSKFPLCGLMKGMQIAMQIPRFDSLPAADKFPVRSGKVASTQAAKYKTQKGMKRALP